MKSFGKNFEWMCLSPSGIPLLCSGTSILTSTHNFHTNFLTQSRSGHITQDKLVKQKFVNSQLANGFPIMFGIHLSQTANVLSHKDRIMCKINGGMNMKVIDENVDNGCMNCTKEANYSFHFCSCCVKQIDVIKQIGV